MYPQGVGDQQEIREPWIPPPGLVALNGPPFHAGEVGQLLL